jgi:uncharacterized protein (TIGR00369 family)
MGIVMDEGALAAFLDAEFPQTAGDFVIERVGEMSIRVRMPVAERHLRPGGTVSGPSMFALADVSVYLAVLAMIGPRALAVTTNCSIDFMRKPAAGADMICECRLLEAGARAGGGGMPSVLRRGRCAGGAGLDDLFHTAGAVTGRKTRVFRLGNLQISRTYFCRKTAPCPRHPQQPSPAWTGGQGTVAQEQKTRQSPRDR